MLGSMCVWNVVHSKTTQVFVVVRSSPLATSITMHGTPLPPPSLFLRVRLLTNIFCYVTENGLQLDLLRLPCCRGHRVPVK